MVALYHHRLGTKVPPDEFEDEDFVTKEYVDGEIADIVVTGGGMPEPDDDGKIYGRQRQSGDAVGSWEEIIGSGGGLEEPPDDGKLYARARQSGDPTGTWEELIGGTVGTADQVMAGNTLTVSNAVGGYSIGSTISTTDTVWDFIKKLLNPRTAAVYVQPSLTLAGSTPLAREIGENVTPTLTPTWSQNDAGVITEYRLYRNATDIYTGPAAIAQTDTAFQLTGSVVYQAQADYGQGPVKNDSEGDPDPAGQIPAGTATSSSVTYVAQRRAFFGKLMVNAVPTTEAQLRALGNDPLNARTMSVDVINSNGACFAYPQAWGTATSIISSQLGNVTSAFSPTTISVAGANGYDPVPYYVYATTSASQATASNIYTLTV